MLVLGVVIAIYKYTMASGPCAACMRGLLSAASGAGLLAASGIGLQAGVVRGPSLLLGKSTAGAASFSSWTRALLEVRATGQCLNMLEHA